MKMHKVFGRTVISVLISLCLTAAAVPGVVSAEEAVSFEERIAANGTGFVPLSEDERTDFLLFGSGAKNADGMQGRWKMLTKDQVQSVKDNSSAKAVFGDFGYSIWLSGRNFSTTDGTTYIYDKGVSGVNRKMLKDIVRKAQRNELVTIEEAEGKKTYAVKLTDEGRAVAEKHEKAQDKIADSVMAALSDEERAQLDAIAEKLIAACKDAGVNGKKKGHKAHRHGHCKHAHGHGHGHGHGHKHGCR